MEDSVFGGPVWSISVETSKEEEVELVIKAKLVAVGAGEVEVVGVKINHLWVFV